jgi:CelD/BcsL family acetyltransferase involved in cellulose biosynthesis
VTAGAAAATAPATQPLPGGAANTVRRVDPCTDPRWLFLACGPSGSLFTSPPWISALSETYGFEPVASVRVDAAGRPDAGLAWVDVRDLRGGRRLALPFCDRADPPAPDLAAWRAVAADALDGDLPFTLRCLDGSPARDDPRLRVVGRAAWHRTALDRPLDELLTSFRSQTRRNIATAERAGVRVVLSADPDAMSEYQRLHVHLRKHKYRLLAQPRTLLHRIHARFAPGDGVRVALALLHGRPVAGAVYLVWGDVVYYKFGASVPEHLSVRPNDAIHWALIQWAHERGLRALDWGLSDLDQPGLVAYKSKWASTAGSILTLNAGGPPIGRSDDVERTLRAVTALFTDADVPDTVTERAGALLYRYFC